jgi:hypothetical protein
MRALAMALLLNVGFMSTALAEEMSAAPVQAETGPAPKYFDFEDDQVEGDMQRPDGLLITGHRKAKHKSLIEIRTNFVPEIIKMTEDF